MMVLTTTIFINNINNNKMNNNQLSVIFPQTKSEIRTFAQSMIDSVLDGNADPLKTKVQLSALKKAIEEIESNEQFKTCILNEAQKYHKEELKDIFNAKIEVKETRVEYDYLSCGMPEYELVCSEIEALTQRKKALETRLKTISEPEQHICALTQQEVTLYPARKKSTTSVVITINK